MLVDSFRNTPTEFLKKFFTSKKDREDQSKLSEVKVLLSNAANELGRFFSLTQVNSMIGSSSIIALRSSIPSLAKQVDSFVRTNLPPNNISSILSRSKGKISHSACILIKFVSPVYGDPEDNSDPGCKGQPWIQQAAPIKVLLDAGFEIKNISGILCGAGDKLEKNIELLRKFVSPVYGDPEDNSDPGRKGQPWIRQAAPVKALLEAGFEINNISSILCGAGDKLEKNIELLRKFVSPVYGDPQYNPNPGRKGQPWIRQAAPVKALLEAGFEINNISSMFHRAGDRLEEYISKLIGNAGNIYCHSTRLLKSIIKLPKEDFDHVLTMFNHIFDKTGFLENIKNMNKKDIIPYLQSTYSEDMCFYKFLQSFSNSDNESDLALFLNDVYDDEWGSSQRKRARLSE